MARWVPGNFCEGKTEVPEVGQISGAPAATAQAPGVPLAGVAEAAAMFTQVAAESTAVVLTRGAIVSIPEDEEAAL